MLCSRPKADLKREAHRQKYYPWAGWKFGHRGFSALSVCVFFYKSKTRRWRLQLYKIKIVCCKENWSKSNDFLADKIKCMVNRISNETQKK